MLWNRQWCSQPLDPRCVPALEQAVKDVDASYDSCNEAWARGEADKFRSKELQTQLLRKATLNRFWWQLNIHNLTQ